MRDRDKGNVVPSDSHDPVVAERKRAGLVYSHFCVLNTKGHIKRQFRTKRYMIRRISTAPFWSAGRLRPSVHPPTYIFARQPYMMLARGTPRGTYYDACTMRSVSRVKVYRSLQM